MRDLASWPYVSILLFRRISFTPSGAVLTSSSSVLIVKQGHVSVVTSNTKYQSESLKDRQKAVNGSPPLTESFSAITVAIDTQRMG